MHKKDYLKDATKKIYSASAARMVEEELDGHILSRKDVYTEFELTDEAAEEKAVADMGDASLVCDSFGEIHNDFYNPVWDIVTLLLHGGLLGGIWYLIRTYVEGDPGLFALLPAALTLAVSLMLADEAVCLKRHLLVPSLFSLLRLAGTTVFNYFILVDIDKAVSSDFTVLVQRLTSPYLLRASNYYQKNTVLFAAMALGLLMLCGVLPSLIWVIRTRTLTLKRSDNRLRRSALKITRYLTFVCLALTLLFGVKMYYDYRSFQKEYLRAYDMVLKLTETCETQEDVDAFIKADSRAFTEEYDTDGNLLGYRYTNNYTDITVNYSFNDELKVSTLDEALIASMGRDERGYVYEVTLSADTTPFKEGMDSLTLGWLRFDDEDIRAFHALDLSQTTAEEEYAHYKKYVPNYVSSAWSTREMWNKEITFIYTFSHDQYKYNQKSYVSFPTEMRLWLTEREKEIIRTIKAHPDADDNELAALLGATVSYKTVNLSDYVENENLGALLGSYTYTIYQLENGVSFIPYYNSGNLATYTLSREQNTTPLLLTFYCGNEAVDYIFPDAYDAEGERANGKYVEDESHGGTDVFRKVAYKGYYYDLKGNCFDNVRYVPYYTRDGRTYYFYSTITRTESTDEYDIKNTYLTDRNKSIYDARQCYIDEDGYLVFDTSGSFQQAEDGSYIAPSGKRYTRALYTSWDNEGNMLPFEDEYDSEVKM